MCYLFVSSFDEVNSFHQQILRVKDKFGIYSFLPIELVTFSMPNTQTYESSMHCFSSQVIFDKHRSKPLQHYDCYIHDASCFCHLTFMLKSTVMISDPCSSCCCTRSLGFTWWTLIINWDCSHDYKLRLFSWHLMADEDKKMIGTW